MQEEVYDPHKSILERRKLLSTSKLYLNSNNITIVYTKKEPSRLFFILLMKRKYVSYIYSIFLHRPSISFKRIRRKSCIGIQWTLWRTTWFC